MVKRPVTLWIYTIIKKMRIALLTAAGLGTRMESNIPKQFITINNKPIIVYTMEAFERFGEIDAIIVVTLEEKENLIWEYAKKYNIH